MLPLAAASGGPSRGLALAPIGCASFVVVLDGIVAPWRDDERSGDRRRGRRVEFIGYGGSQFEFPAVPLLRGALLVPGLREAF